MTATTAFESIPWGPVYAPEEDPSDPWELPHTLEGRNVSLEHYEALAEDIKRAHDMAPQAARARAAYKRLARRGGPVEEIPEALRAATELSTQRYELLHTTARNAQTMLDKAGPADDRERLEALAMEASARAQGCEDLRLLQM